MTGPGPIHPSTRKSLPSAKMSDAVQRTAASCDKATRETRTRDLSFTKARGHSTTHDQTGACESRSATPSSSPSSSGGNPPLNDDLRGLIDAWPSLPEPVRVGIVAMVRAARSTRPPAEFAEGRSPVASGVAQACRFDALSPETPGC